VNACQGFFEKVPTKQAIDLPMSSFIRALADVEDHRKATGAIEAPSPVPFEPYGMETSLVLEDRDKFIVHGQYRSVVDYRGESVEEVLINTPGSTQGLGDLQYRVNFLSVAEVNIGAPFPVIGISVVAKLGEQVEVEVIVGVDEPGEGQGVGEG
jgi:hypothetical protein